MLFRSAKHIDPLSILTEGPKNILLGNFLSVQSVKPLLVNMAHSNAMSLFCVMVDRNHVFKLAKENDKVLIYGPEPGTLIISLGIF